MTTFTSPFTGDVVQPTDVSYLSLPFSANVSLTWPAYVAPGGVDTAAARIIDCNPSAGSLIVTLPYGSQGSVGTDILFRNISAFSFTIQDKDNANSVTLAAGDARYFYLVSNSTSAGVWRNFTYGTGTSAADAASLAGSGLTTSSGLLATSYGIVTTAVSPTINNASRALSYVWTGGADTITLPTAASITPGWYILFRNSGTGAISMVPQGTSTLNGSVTVTFNPGDSGMIVFDYVNGDYYTVGLANPNSAMFTAATYDVDSVVGSTLDLISFAPSIQTYVALAGTRATDLDVVLPAVTQLYVLSNATNQTGYDVTFQVSGSSQAPIPVAANTTAMVLSDGNFLYILTQSGTATYLVTDGSAAAPSFSFISDPSTGMYLLSAAQLGLTAGGVNMMTLNNSNPLSPQITTTATFNAALISGGTF
jgi:hypothetical protein